MNVLVGLTIAIPMPIAPTLIYLSFVPVPLDTLEMELSVKVNV